MTKVFLSTGPEFSKSLPKSAATPSKRSTVRENAADAIDTMELPTGKSA